MPALQRRWCQRWYVSLSETEYAVLRQTIATRGTTRAILLPVTIIGWGAISLAILLVSPHPVASLVGLTVLAGGFEAIHGLHVGVERIGRYLQVYYEADRDTPKWETTAMTVGPSLPGGGTDPLFTAIVGAATLVNLAVGILNRPTPIELILLALLHLGFLIRIVRSRIAAARQRAVELESFRALRVNQHDHH